MTVYDSVSPRDEIYCVRKVAWLLYQCDSRYTPGMSLSHNVDSCVGGTVKIQLQFVGLRIGQPFRTHPCALWQQIPPPPNTHPTSHTVSYTHTPHTQVSKKSGLNPSNNDIPSARQLYATCITLTLHERLNVTNHMLLDRLFKRLFRLTLNE